MNTIHASEIERHGIGALEKAVESGPVHVIGINRPTLVVMNEQQYAALTVAAANTTHGPRMSVWDYVVNRPHDGTRTRTEIDTQIAEERRSWGNR